MKGLGPNPCVIHGGKRSPKRQTRPLGWELQTQKPSLQVKRKKLPRKMSYEARKRREFANEAKSVSFMGMTVVVKRSMVK